MWPVKCWIRGDLWKSRKANEDHFWGGFWIHNKIDVYLEIFCIWSNLTTSVEKVLASSVQMSLLVATYIHNMVLPRFLADQVAVTVNMYLTSSCQRFCTFSFWVLKWIVVLFLLLFRLVYCSVLYVGWYYKIIVGAECDCMRVFIESATSLLWPPLGGFWSWRWWLWPKKPQMSLFQFPFRIPMPALGSCTQQRVFGLSGCWQHDVVKGKYLN